MNLRRIAGGCLLLSMLGRAVGDETSPISLTNSTVSVTCVPALLEVVIRTSDGEPFKLGTDWIETEPVRDLRVSASNITWQLPGRQWQVTLQLLTNGARVDFTAAMPGVLDWPVFAPDATARDWILPLFEGVCVPSDDAAWQRHLRNESPLNTTAGFTLPFFAIRTDRHTLTCQWLNSFNNTVHFDAPNGRLRLRSAHEFTRNQPAKHFALQITVGGPSPVEPARQYRGRLIEHGEFASLADKINRTPEAAKLLGAAHVYLWGDALLSVEDVADWKKLTQQLKEQTTAVTRRAWSLMNHESRGVVTNLASAEWPDRYLKGVLARALSEALMQTNFSLATAALSEAERCQRNCTELAAALPGVFKPVETWGEGQSPQMIRELAAAGLNRLWLGADGWAGLVRRPQTVTLAKEHGYLIGTYDSYHSMHSPKIAPDDTWATAQFDEALYRTGAIVNAKGQPLRGFKQRGFNLSPAAARPYVERRVSSLMKIFPANSWFIDCDGFGEFFDDYSPAHPATQAQDLAQRMERCAWIRDQFGAVIGSEGCSAGAASTLHFAHGVLTPVIGWGDADLTNKQSKYYLGSYYPPGEPAVFFKPAQVKPEFCHLFYNPRFRVPLFQTVFHDSVVATHHWSNPSLKFPEVAGTVELLELLYNVPPVYHLNRPEFARRKAEIKRHYEVFSPLHRELAGLLMSDFSWLTSDRLVQRTRFGTGAELTANFSEHSFVEGGREIPPQTILIRSGDKLIFHPASRAK